MSQPPRDNTNTTPSGRPQRGGERHHAAEQGRPAGDGHRFHGFNILDVLTSTDEQIEQLREEMQDGFARLGEQQREISDVLAEGLKSVNSEEARELAIPERYIVYPDTESKSRTLLPSGTSTLDFATGTASHPDGTTESMAGSIEDFKNVGEMRSLILWSDMDMTVSIDRRGTGDTASGFYVDQATYFTVDDWPFSTIEVEPRGSYAARVYCVASSLPEMPLTRLPVATNHERVATGVTTDASWSTVQEQWMVNLDRKTFQVSNTGSESAQLRLQKSLDTSAVGWATIATTTVASGEDWVYDTQEFGRAFRLRAQDGSGSTTLDYAGGGAT